MEWLRKAPTTVVITVIVTCGVLAAVLVAAFVVLEVQGADTAEFRRWIGTVGQLLVYPLLGITTVASVSSARSASRADDQTNGQLQAKDQTIEARDQTIAALRSENARLERRNGGMR